MTELDRVGNSDNFNFRGGGFIVSASSQATRKKEGIFARSWCYYISIAKFRVLDCPVIKNKVLMLIYI